MKCEPIRDRGFARAAMRAGLRARTVLRTGRLWLIALRRWAVLRFAIVRRFAAMLRFAAGRRFATVRRFAAMLRRAVVRRFAMVRRAVARRFAVVRLAAVLRAGFARRTVFLPWTARRVREGLFFAVRFRDVLDLLNITIYPPQLKVSRPWLLWVNTV